MGYFGQYVKENKEEMESKFLILENNSIIDVDDILPDGITDVFRTIEKDGKQIEIHKKQYEFLNGKKMEVPLSVNVKIMRMFQEYQEQGTEVLRFKVTKTGNGVQTKYDVIPIFIGHTISKDKSGADQTIKVGGK